MKGYNQVDLAIAVGIIIFVIFLSIYYTSHFVQPSINRAKFSEMKYLARGLSETVFNDLGIPEEWQWSDNVVKPSLGSYIYRVPVHLKEWNGTDNNDVMAFAYLETDENAYNSSIVVYDGNQTLDTELKNMVDSDSDGFLEEVNVTFHVSVPANEEKIIYIYYSRDNETSVSYQSLSDENNTLNVTKFSPEKLLGLTTSKLNALQSIPPQEAREKFGLDYPFRLVVKKTGGNWEYGHNLTDEETGVYRRKVLFQNSTGHIKSVSAITYVWK